MNLAVNSRDAMPEGGRLTVFTRNASKPPQGEEDAENQNWVVLEVEDTGTGMDEETRREFSSRSSRQSSTVEGQDWGSRRSMES